MRESENNESEILRSWNTMNNLNSNEIKNENMFWDSNKLIVVRADVLKVPFARVQMDYLNMHS